MTVHDIIKVFNSEFEWVAHRFEIYHLSLSVAEYLTELHICNPGVYVFWHPERSVIKVGRHLENSRKRAFEHIRDDTGKAMAILRNDDDARLLLFNVKESKDKHWVAALEIFFETKLNPEIRSLRL